MVVDCHAITGLRATGSFVDSVRDRSLHDSKTCESLAASAGDRWRADNDNLVDGRDRDSVLLGNVRRLFRRRQWNPDAGGAGYARPAQHPSRQRR